MLLHWLTPGARRAFVGTNASTSTFRLLLLAKTAHDTKTGTRCDRCIIYSSFEIIPAQSLRGFQATLFNSYPLDLKLRAYALYQEESWTALARNRSPCWSVFVRLENNSRPSIARQLSRRAAASTQGSRWPSALAKLLRAFILQPRLGTGLLLTDPPSHRRYAPP